MLPVPAVWQFPAAAARKNAAEQQSTANRQRLSRLRFEEDASIEILRKSCEEQRIIRAFAREGDHVSPWDV
jgi:hypothetical protein